MMFFAFIFSFRGSNIWNPYEFYEFLEFFILFNILIRYFAALQYLLPAWAKAES